MSEMSQRILEIILSKEISYGELADRTGIPKSALQRYATGATEKIPIDRLIRIANALGVDPYSLMDFDTATSVLEDRINKRIKETPATPGKRLEEYENTCGRNVIRIAGRNGSYEERVLSDEQLSALKAIIDQMPDASDDL